MNFFSKTSFILLIALFLTACTHDPYEGFVETKQGYLFKICTTHSEAPRPQVGDILVGEITVKFNDSTKLFSNLGTPKRLFTVKTPVEGSLDELFLSMHLEDSLIIISPAEYVCSFVTDLDYQAGDKLYYYFKLSGIVSKHQQTEAEKEDETALAEERSSIQQYLEKHRLNIQPDSSGLYFRYLKRHEGTPARLGDKVKVFYTVRMLNDIIVQTNVKSVADRHKLNITPSILRSFDFTLGDDGIISAWTETLLRMCQGDQVQIIVPSKLAYGKEGSRHIPPYTPLVFDLYLSSVEPRP